MPVFNSKFDYIICAYAIKKFKFFFLGEELKQMNDQKPNIITEKCTLLNDFELTLCVAARILFGFVSLPPKTVILVRKGTSMGAMTRSTFFFFIEYMHTMRWQANVNKYDRSIDFT